MKSFVQLFIDFSRSEKKLVLKYMCVELTRADCSFDLFSAFAEPRSSVGNIADLRTGGRWFDPRLGNILSED